MGNDIREEVAAGLTDEDFSGVVVDSPIVESDGDLQGENHTEREDEVFSFREKENLFPRQERESGTGKSDDGDTENDQE